VRAPWCKFALPASLALSGCGTVATNEAIGNLRAGMSTVELIALMGRPPDRQETHGATEFYFYKTGYGFEVSTMTPIAIVDGKVVDWGRYQYARTLKAPAPPQ